MSGDSVQQINHFNITRSMFQLTGVANVFLNTEMLYFQIEAKVLRPCWTHLCDTIEEGQRDVLTARPKVKNLFSSVQLKLILTLSTVGRMHLYYINFVADLTLLGSCSLLVALSVLDTTTALLGQHKFRRWSYLSQFYDS